MPVKTLILRWSVLFILSAVAIGGFMTLHLAAGLMIGPMMAGIVMAVMSHDVTIRRPFFALAQAVLACIVAGSISPPVIDGILQHSLLMIFSVFSVIIVSFGTGAILAWLGIMPGTTALWGSSPGGASTMVTICGEFGADPRLAAFMLYFRVILVALSTSLVAWFVTTDPHQEAYLPAVPGGNILPTLILIIGGGLLGMRLRFLPGAPLLFTMFLGGVAQLSGLFTVCTPQWVRIPAYLIIGWSIGLRFTVPILRHALSTLPAVILSSTILIGACALLALPVAHFAHIDMLSAYLATSPGGLDTVIIISSGVPVALPFIISLQTARMLTVLAIGPIIARPLGAWLERHARKKPQKTP